MKIPRPTDAELVILRALNKGACTVREAHDVLAKERPIAYTTTLKMLQIISEKGLVVREERGRQHYFRARHAEADMQKRLVGDLLDRAFGGSPAALVMQALAHQRATPEELREIRRLLAAHTQKAKKEEKS